MSLKNSASYRSAMLFQAVLVSLALLMILSSTVVTPIAEYTLIPNCVRKMRWSKSMVTYVRAWPTCDESYTVGPQLYQE